MTIATCTSAGVDAKTPTTPSLTGLKLDDPPKVDSDCLPEVDSREGSYPETAYSSLPEVVEFPHEPESSTLAAEKPLDGSETVPFEASSIGDRGKSWWQRCKTPLLLIVLVCAGVAIGCGIGVGLAAGNGPSASDGSDISGSSNPSSPAQTAPSPSLAAASSSSTAQQPSPTSSVYLASLLRGPTLLSSAGLLQDDNSTACRSAVPYAAPGRAPCDQPFELSDGLTYRWRGCGQLPTYVTWAVGADGDETRLGVCDDVPPAARWDCGGGQTLAAEWLCGPAAV
ncbi:hypothetical protein HYQ45_003686 [Verticillium longisporum]|uniref:Uncharacterized protein n=1 Tax=Verticillium longisporum TaxID=100787 RepID=A0A8I2ZUK1_VERLO|nr:hypothetical protein HYQ45_003686 [Verticillium longisporum]